VNKELYDKKIVFPDEMREHMRVSHHSAKDADKNGEGYKRNQELQGQKSLTYQQLKRIKNFFDNFQGKDVDHEFILNGGVKMKNWVDNELRRMREGIFMTNHNKSETGMQNQHIKTHSKDGIDVRPSKEHSRTVDKYNTAVTESLKRINELISKI
jgi:hypothetical protein